MGKLKWRKLREYLNEGESGLQSPLRSCFALILFLTEAFKVFPAGFLKAFFTFSVRSRVSFLRGKG